MEDKEDKIKLHIRESAIAPEANVKYDSQEVMVEVNRRFQWCIHPKDNLKHTQTMMGVEYYFSGLDNHMAKMVLEKLHPTPEVEYVSVISEIHFETNPSRFMQWINDLEIKIGYPAHTCFAFFFKTPKDGNSQGLRESPEQGTWQRNSSPSAQV